MKILLAILGFALAFSVQAQETDKFNGTPAIPFSAQDIAGETYASEALKGKVIVLNLWATFCKPCILEMPELNKLKKEFAGKEVVFISMSPEDKATLRKFFKKNQFDFAVLPSSGNYMMNFGNSLPQTILIDKAGIIREVSTGTLPVEVRKDSEGTDMYNFNSSKIKSKLNALLAE
ncbi:TlpA family protein disulfide reductase [Pontibacter sp. KCTC 32443]|uniref:TlpA family protein disulfide reductase n=1 Tax=Pontibacter TaxID=323449 RepID=UPI00164D1A4E|nr:MULTISPECIES: TlpA disulfide reductase family protein [Pontibacter]MBC5775209.1 TlpA family protein disulfide reductase [Pontibacter sp. KCTC 32443]